MEVEMEVEVEIEEKAFKVFQLEFTTSRSLRHFPGLNNNNDT